MQIPSSYSDRARAAFQALQTGKPAEAKALFDAEVDAGTTDVTLLMGLAMAHRDMNEPDLAIGVLDRLLAVEPRHFLGLMMRADAALAAGRKREAASYYNAAVSVAPPAERQAPHVRGHVERARQVASGLVSDYESYLRDTLVAQGFDVAAEAPGHASQAVDILFGRRQIYVQQPEQFFYPGLPQRQFYERAEFEWAAALEAETGAIAEEARAVLALDDAFQPYQHANVTGPRTRHSKLYNSPDWSAAYLIHSGEVNDAVAQHCPTAMGALEQVPLCDVPGKNPTVLFSLLRPGTHIEPHHGLVNTRLIVHLPLIVPAGCTLRVGNERREWREGELMIFDDSIEHEAHNPTDALRVVLLFDIWRPELTDRDRQFVRATFQAIEAYQ